jgi:membrane-associated phospholipid phosphatase
VYNSIAVNHSIWHSEQFHDRPKVRYGSAILMVSIILSTMFLKQHSVFDVVTGIVLALFVNSFVYRTDVSRTSLSQRYEQRKLHNI